MRSHVLPKITLTASSPLPEALDGESGGVSLTCDWWSLVVSAGRGGTSLCASSQKRGCVMPSTSQGRCENPAR